MATTLPRSNAALRMPSFERRTNFNPAPVYAYVLEPLSIQGQNMQQIEVLQRLRAADRTLRDRIRKRRHAR
ncbi:hypothetical protein CEJ86_11980 [Sinorhizobium meliloti]|uniref:Uncharacterized protein n=1 Tax=Rhizobium meliloti TaxID=382 RepID=A0A2J0Z4H4_RHIML|nr:hypothetical protein CEJ86_11980 [Sinorhizobium meliloti]